MRVFCDEKGGGVWRGVWPLVREPDNITTLIERMKGVDNFLSKHDPAAIFLDPRNSFYLVDNVGVVAVVNKQHCHVTFWDGRLRGREALCYALAMFHMEAAGLDMLWTAIPTEKETVVAFAKRAGFEMVSERQGVTVLVIRRSEYGN